MSKSQPASHNVRTTPSATKPLVSATLADGGILETLYDPVEKRTSFCLARDDQWKIIGDIVIDRQKYVPYSPENNLIQHGTVLFPSGVEDFVSESELVGEIRAFIHRYVDLAPLFEEVAIRIPFVISITRLMVFPVANSRISKMFGCVAGSPPLIIAMSS